MATRSARREATGTPRAKQSKPASRAKGAARAPGLAFVVQKHRARTLHYDLRLQVGETLRSWVLPRGPSLDPGVRRLAVEGEDQPAGELDALEGVIPEGEYGAGAVMLWDGGTVRAASFSGAGESDALRRGLEAGRLEFVLEGRRLRGAFTLVRTRGGAGKRAQWFLAKQDDAHARPGSEIVAEELTSAASGLTLEEIAARGDGDRDPDESIDEASMKGGRAASKGKDARRGAAVTRRAPTGRTLSLGGGPPVVGRAKTASAATKGPREPSPARRSIAPDTLEPMYATIGTGVPSGDDWTFEPKYDGVRVLAHVSRRSVRLITRNLKDKSAQFPEIVEALARLAEKSERVLILDGEVVALDDRGEPARFQALQARMHVKNALDVAHHVERTPSALVVFDILRDGEDVLLDEPWSVRRKRLEQRLRGVAPRRSSGSTRRAGGVVRLGGSRRGDGAAFLEEMRREGWEGVIAKRTSALYRPGKRSDDWLKLKVEFRQEFVIGGWTEPRNTREHIGALLLGYYAGDEFVYVGHTGGGFTREGLQRMYRKLAPLERKSSPFVTPPRTNERAHWATPKVVVEVKFAEWTADGKLRQPIYLGTRDDKDAREVTLERESVQRRATRGRNGRGDA